MTTQNQYHHAALRNRKEIERRQANTKTTLVRPPPTRTPVKPPAKTPVRTVTPVVPAPTPAKTAIIAPVPTTSPLVSLPPINTLVTGVVPGVVPTPTTSNTLPPSTTPLPSTTSTADRVIHSHTTSTQLPTSTSSATPASTGGVSTGAVVGGIIGGFAALGFIGAALFLFLRRVKEKKEKNDEVFDAAKFRQSAVQLDAPAEKRGKPRPPTIIEQLVQSRPSPQPSSFPSSSGTHYPTEQARYGVPYRNQSSHGSTYPASYGARNPYEQYPSQANAYGYGAPHGYPPQSHYGAQQYGTHQYDAHPLPVPPPVRSTNLLESGQDKLSLPNPFSPPAPNTVSPHYSSYTSSVSTMRSPPTSASNHAPPTTEDSDAPPAYEVTTKFRDFKADVKARPGLTVTNTAANSPSDALSPTSQTPTDADGSVPSALSSHLAPATATVTTSRSGAANKALPTRPLSDTSAITTVYDLNDAYGGM